MIDPEQIELLRESVQIQRQRRRNWQGGDAPRDAVLEELHKERIEAIQDQLSARPQVGAGTSESPAGGGSSFSKGVLLPTPAGTFLSRWLRRIFSH